MRQVVTGICILGTSKSGSQVAELSYILVSLDMQQNYPHTHSSVTGQFEAPA